MHVRILFEKNSGTFYILAALFQSILFSTCLIYNYISIHLKDAGCRVTFKMLVTT